MAHDLKPTLADIIRKAEEGSARNKRGGNTHNEFAEIIQMTHTIQRQLARQVAKLETSNGS